MIRVKETSLQFNKKIKVGFSGGALSSDFGLLLYREFDVKTGFSRPVHVQLNVKDSVSHTIHSNAEIVIQKIYQHLAGYHTDDQTGELGTEPVFMPFLGKDGLVSQEATEKVHKIKFMRAPLLTLSEGRGPSSVMEV